MRKNLGPNPYVYPQPVLIVATYGEDGTADAMNVAYGGIVNSNRIQINIGVRHKTSDNIKIKNAFTVGIADEKKMHGCRIFCLQRNLFIFYYCVSAAIFAFFSSFVIIPISPV